MAKVLVIDTRPFMLRYMEHLVTRAGHKPIKARTSAEVTEALAHDKPAVVVMDVCPDQMESMQKALSEKPSAKPIPVIIMSGLPNQAPEIGPLKAAAVFHQPCSPTQLVGAIEQLLAEAA